MQASLPLSCKTMETKKDDNRNNGADMGREVELKKGQPKEGSPSAVAASMVTELLESDILLGRGRGAHDHPGNLRMRETLGSYRTKYFEAKRGVKQLVVMEAYHELIQDEVRFLKRIDEEDHWVVVDKETAIMKVGHYLRSNKQTQQLQVKPEFNVPIVSTDERASRQYQSGRLRESSPHLLSTLKPSLRNGYDSPSILSLGSLSQRLLWERMQPQYPVAQPALSGWSSLQTPYVSSLTELVGVPSRVLAPSTVGTIGVPSWVLAPAVDAIGAHSRVLAPSTVAAMELLALRMEVVRELQQDQTRGTRGPH